MFDPVPQAAVGLMWAQILSFLRGAEKQKQIEEGEGTDGQMLVAASPIEE